VTSAAQQFGGGFYHLGAPAIEHLGAGEHHLDLAIEAACLEFECRNFELTRTMALRTLRTVR
jgi:hypothetical protein